MCERAALLFEPDGGGNVGEKFRTNACIFLFREGIRDEGGSSSLVDACGKSLEMSCLHRRSEVSLPPLAHEIKGFLLSPFPTRHAACYGCRGCASVTRVGCGMPPETNGGTATRRVALRRFASLCARTDVGRKRRSADLPKRRRKLNGD